ncbi:MAG: hypothetical protein CSA95_05165 [Bacteroidetes bacterium]|nr:MAG: hypothetical protein CSA95_05165 [Bacteroidota bacterium]
MKKQGNIELITGALGAAILLATQNEWGYIPLILYGILSVVMIRRSETAKTDVEKRGIKKRNILSVILFPFFAVICYFSANAPLENHFLWLLLSVYLFLTAHGILFRIRL